MNGILIAQKYEKAAFLKIWKISGLWSLPSPDLSTDGIS